MIRIASQALTTTALCWIYYKPNPTENDTRTTHVTRLQALEVIHKIVIHSREHKGEMLGTPKSSVIEQVKC